MIGRENCCITFIISYIITIFCGEEIIGERKRNERVELFLVIPRSFLKCLGTKDDSLHDKIENATLIAGHGKVDPHRGRSPAL